MTEHLTTQRKHGERLGVLKTLDDFSPISLNALVGSANKVTSHRGGSRMTALPVARGDVEQSASPQANLRNQLRTALDAADLLVTDVLEPAVRYDPNAAVVKEATEVATLLMLAARVLTGSADLARILDLARRCSPLCRGESARHRPVKRPGADSPRLLDREWTRQLLRRDDAFAESTERFTPTGVGMDLVDTTLEEARAFSHVLAYATDYGRLPLPRWVDVEAVREIADVLIVQSLAADDLDVLAELLMAAAIVRQPYTPIQAFGWRVLMATWHRYPMLPGSVYRTTVVAGLLVATVLSRGCLPADPWPVTDAPAPNDRSSMWEQEWERLDHEAQREFAVVLEAMTLHEAVSSLDGTAMMQAAREGSMLPTVWVRQVVGLLDRLQMSDVSTPGAAAGRRGGNSLAGRGVVLRS